MSPGYSGDAHGDRITDHPIPFYIEDILIPMMNPTHPGLSMLDSLEAVGWTVQKFANRLRIDEVEVSGLLNGECGISPAMVLALDRLGWSNAAFWMRKQASYDLAQERLRAGLDTHDQPISGESVGNIPTDKSVADATAYYQPKLGTLILTDYIDEAMCRAVYEKMEDGTYCGTIPPCVGVIAFADTRRKCINELQATLEDWLLMGLKLGHPIPPLHGIDLNGQPERESLDAL